MAEHGVVVQVELGVQGQHVAALGDHQGVDLRQGAVQVDEGPVEVFDETHRRAQQFRVEAHPEDQVAGLVAHAAGDGVDRLFDDQLRAAGRHFFDIHAARGAHHDHRPAQPPVRDDPQIKLLGDILGLFHQDLVDQAPFGAGLGRDQGHAQDLVRHPLHFLGGGRGLDAAALAPAAGVDLGLDHKGAFRQLFGHLAGLQVGVGHPPFGHRHVKFPEQFLSLILVNLHRSSFQQSCMGLGPIRKP